MLTNEQNFGDSNVIGHSLNWQSPSYHWICSCFRSMPSTSIYVIHRMRKVMCRDCSSVVSFKLFRLLMRQFFFVLIWLFNGGNEPKAVRNESVQCAQQTHTHTYIHTEIRARVCSSTTTWQLFLNTRAKVIQTNKSFKKKNCGLCCIRQARERISGLQTNACKEEWTKIKLAGRLLNSKSIEIISFWITEFGHGPDTNSFRISTRPNFEHFRARTILFIKSTSCILSVMVTCCSSI